MFSRVWRRRLATDNMGYALSRLEIDSEYFDSDTSNSGFDENSSPNKPTNILDHEVAQLTKLRSEPHENPGDIFPGKRGSSVNTVKMLAGRECNYSGRGRFSSADRCHVLNKYLPGKSPSVVDRMTTRAYVSQFSADGSLCVVAFQNTKNTRTYWYEGRNGQDGEPSEDLPVGLPEEDFTATEELFAHPRHSKKMRPHQIEGFNFLVRNLVTENPGGCILAHAPGSGKTFMIISFIQSFMAKYPFARPLIILPKGIMQIWKKEFLLWQVDVIPLLDFYSVKAEGRGQQLEILKQWARERSILFLGYQQFSSIVRDDHTRMTTTACQEIRLTHPSLLILDEGHTPRNEETAMLAALEKVKTPRKVVIGPVWEPLIRG